MSNEGHQDKTKLKAVMDEVIFVPTPSMRAAKARYTVAQADNPLLSGDSPTLAMVQQYVPDDRLRRWWAVPGFREWFTNSSEWKERVEYLADSALSVLEEILMDGDEKGAVRINAGKLILEASGKVGKKKDDGEGRRFSDEEINKMNKKQLEEFFSRRNIDISNIQPLELGDSDAEEDDQTH